MARVNTGLEMPVGTEMSTLKRFARQVLPAAMMVAVCILVWYAFSYLVLDESRRFLLRPLHEVVLVGFLDYDNLKEVLSGLWQTAIVSFAGFQISVVCGLTLAMVMSQTKMLERAVFPFMVALQAIPILAIVPLVGFWSGYGQRSRVVVCVLISLFPIVVNTLFGLQSADRSMHDLFTLHHAGRFTRLRKLMFPAALPAIFSGLRISAGLSVVGAIVGDFFFVRGERGLGQLLDLYSKQLQGEKLIAAVIVSSALGITVFWCLGALRSWLTGKWAS